MIALGERYKLTCEHRPPWPHGKSLFFCLSVGFPGCDSSSRMFDPIFGGDGCGCRWDTHRASSTSCCLSSSSFFRLSTCTFNSIFCKRHSVQQRNKLEFLFRPQNRSQSGVSIFTLTHCFVKHKRSHVFSPLTPFNRDTVPHWPDSLCSSTETVCYFVPQLCRLLHISTNHHHVGVKFCSAVQRLRAARADLYLREHCGTINSGECYAHLLYLSLNPPTPSIKHSAAPPPTQQHLHF